MSDVTTELVLGAQARAAQRVADAAPRLQSTLARLGDDLQPDLAGFSGAAAGEFYSAVVAWSSAAKRIPEAVLAYGAKLVAVDRSALASQLEAAAAYQRATRRLDGQP